LDAERASGAGSGKPASSPENRGPAALSSIAPPKPPDTVGGMIGDVLYRRLLRPLLFRCDPEQAHHIAMMALSACWRLRGPMPLLRALSGAAHSGSSDERLSRTVFGIPFSNPIGLAAGFDKDGIALPAWPALGFGFLEVGTITAQPQPGNPRPRIFRIPEKRALINRLGFNNRGAQAAARRFAGLRAAGRWPSIPVGINIGKSKVTPLEAAAEDYVASFEQLHEYGDYFVLNVSSPNTPGLRGLQQGAELDHLLQAVQRKNRVLPAPRPILLKIAPDLTFAQIEEIIELAQRHELSGIVATNTTIDRSGVPGSAAHLEGGLSGEPLRARSTEIVRFLAGRTSLPIIAVGGVSDAASAREKLDAGAVLVQLYTGLIYEGPTLVSRICRELAAQR
jgi:dihydroorotate dehydrogenase